MKELSNFKNSCRLCEGTNLKKIINLPKSQPVDNFRKIFHKDLELPTFSMDLYMCITCNHAQLLNVVLPKILYGNYVYLSNSSPDLNRHFEDYSDFLFKNNYLNENSNILDIGCNDGLLLDFLKRKGVITFGIDPAPKAVEICLKNGHNIYEDYFNSDSAKKILNNSKKKFDVITANNVFSHSDDLFGILINAKNILSDDGYYIFEVSYLADTIKNRVIDYIYHEHLSYHSIKSLVPFLKRAGMYIYDVAKIKTKGGSIRVVTGKKQALENKKLISKFVKEEQSLKIYDLEFYKNINKEIERSVKIVNQELQKIKNKNKNVKIYAYGACATGIVLSRIMNLDKYLCAYVDDNNAKTHTLSPNSYLPVISLNEVEKENSIILILAWRFENIIRDKVKNILGNDVRVITLKPIMRSIA